MCLGRVKQLGASLAVLTFVGLLHLGGYYGSMSSVCGPPIQLWSPWNGSAYLHVPPLDHASEIVSTPTGKGEAR
jgi:hypothetical protein